MLTLAGCRQDMHNQPKFVPLRASEFFADGRSARPLIAGTVDRSDSIQDPGYMTGFANYVAVETMPFPVTRPVLQRGRERFNIYCSPCHGELADGNGMVVQRGYLRPPTLHDDRIRQMPVGQIFNIISFGLGGMPDYAEQISIEDRWKIVAYIRALQLSQNATLHDVPADIRGKLGQALPLPQEGVTGKTGMQGMAPPIERSAPPATGVPEQPEKKP